MSVGCSERFRASRVSFLLLYKPPPSCSSPSKTAHHNKLCPTLGFPTHFA